MLHQFRKVLYTLVFNGSLFLVLIVGIQNSNNQSKVRFFKNETIKLPISFIIGLSFISGSIFGNFINLKIFEENNL